MTRMKVVRFDISFTVAAPMYVHADRMPPKRSRSTASTGPLYGTSTVLPSDDR